MDTEAFSEILSEALLELPHLEGIVIAYLRDDETVHTSYQGGRVLCRGLAEEMVDRMKEELVEAEEIGEAEG